MAKQSAQLLFAASVLVGSFFTLNAFNKAPAKDIVTGGGITNENHFNFNAVAKKNAPGTVGHFQWDGQDYEVTSVVKEGTLATIYLTLEGTIYYSTVEDGGKDDRISAPAPAPLLNEVIDETQGAVLIGVTGGNITIHK